MVALDLTHLSKSQLLSLIDRGILSVTMTDQIPSTRDETPEYQKFAHLRGTAIHISAAARKYNVPAPTITRWVKRGLIQIVGSDKNRLLIDEADIAYCATIRAERPGQGKTLFNPDGTPR